MRHKTPRKPAQQILLFCFVILLFLGGMGIILISILEENRAYSDGQAEADSLLEELRFPSSQEAPESTEEQMAIISIDDPPSTTKPWNRRTFCPRSRKPFHLRNKRPFRLPAQGTRRKKPAQQIHPFLLNRR
ncbi:MAG: hypothetical protein Q4G00_10150 [Clostridia bacterium]|nr:hypothetical protein [Clostridia bacterium]